MRPCDHARPGRARAVTNTIPVSAPAGRDLAKTIEKEANNMSNKQPGDGAQVDALPFFAHLLSAQSDPAKGDGPAPTYHCLDAPCTKKYPSDDDESTTWMKDTDW